MCGIDGSGFNIFYNPNDPDTYNPPSGKSKLGNNEIHVVASYRLTDHIFTDAVIQPRRKKNEYSAVCDIIDSCTFDGGIPIFLADRGFPSYNMFAHAKEKGVFFLVRAKDFYNEPPRSRATGYQTPSFSLACYTAELRGINPKEN